MTSSITAVAACSAYDTRDRDLRLRDYLERAAAGATAPRDAGTDADTGDTGGGGTSAGPDADATCGDGKVSLSEKCDVAIPPGWPGACPSSCPPLIDCLARELSGSNCQAECVVLAPQCTGGDACCPAHCTSDEDDDCSERCGDGEVQETEGETCEPLITGAQCVTIADCDDGDPCTNDVLVGSHNNCNARCSHVPVEALVTGDRCCPPGANANTDGDCPSVCGNSVREPGEECDGTEPCDPECKLTANSKEMACLATLDAGANECDRCSCTQCAPERLDCVATGVAERDRHCGAIIQCANENDCYGAACYCRNAWCWYEGPCRDVIDEAAAADPSGASVITQNDDPETAIYRALSVGRCKATHCADVCP